MQSRRKENRVGDLARVEVVRCLYCCSDIAPSAVTVHFDGQTGVCFHRKKAKERELDATFLDYEI